MLLMQWVGKFLNGIQYEPFPEPVIATRDAFIFYFKSPLYLYRDALVLALVVQVAAGETVAGLGRVVEVELALQILSDRVVFAHGPDIYVSFCTHRRQRCNICNRSQL